MHLEQVIRRFRTLESTGLVCRLNAGADEAQFRECEERLGVSLPAQIVAFWTEINGLRVDDPPLEVLPLSQLYLEGTALIFASCHTDVRLAFDTSAINCAGEWSIISVHTRYRITLTMASFWSIHMWTWIVKRRPIWFDVHLDRTLTLSATIGGSIDAY